MDTGHYTYIPQPACEATHLLNSDVFPTNEIVTHHGHQRYNTITIYVDRWTGWNFGCASILQRPLIARIT